MKKKKIGKIIQKEYFIQIKNKKVEVVEKDEKTRMKETVSALQGKSPYGANDLFYEMVTSKKIYGIKEKQFLEEVANFIVEENKDKIKKDTKIHVLCYKI